MGNRKITIVDVAHAAGVSQATVAYILSGSKKYSFQQSTIERVNQAVRTLNYVPNPLATSLRSQRNNIIIGVFGHVFGNFEFTVTNHLRQEFLKNGYYFVAQFMTDMSDQDRVNFFRTIHRWGAGLVIYDIGVYPESPYRSEIIGLLNQSPPTVVLLNEIEGCLADYIKVDWFREAHCIFEYLKSRGCRKLVYCTPVLDDRLASDRLGMFSLQYGIELQMWSMEPGDRNSYDFYSLGECTADYILAHPEECPDAIYCLSDESLMAIQNVIRQKGTDAMKRIVVVGGGDTRYSCEGKTAFPVFSLNPRELAEASTAHLLKRLNEHSSVVGNHECILNLKQRLVMPNLEDESGTRPLRKL